MPGNFDSICMMSVSESTNSSKWLTVRWFSKFRSGDLSLQESDRSGPPSKIDNDVLRSMLENNPHITSQEISEEFGIHHTTVGDHIKYLGKGPVYYELPKQGKTINADLYCNQLDKLNAAIKEKRPPLASRKGIVFHHDNARPRTAMVTQQKLNALGWEILRHPPYSLDITSSDYYLFRSLQNYLTEKFKSIESVSKAVAVYFNSKHENFYKIGIYMLPERWQQIVTNNGACIID
ncbi:mariner Mos1 transposase [Trichonephila clavipes]|nr:mariner Mos1 transposase [Trichonephila clavipes]